MERHRVTKENILITLRNIGVELYSVEEALIHANHNLTEVGDLKKCLANLVEAVGQAQLPPEIPFDKPNPAYTMLVRSSTVQPVRKNMCKGT